MKFRMPMIEEHLDHVDFCTIRSRIRVIMRESLGAGVLVCSISDERLHFA